MSLINIFLVLGTVKTMINDSLQPCGRQFKEATINTWWFPSVGPSYFIQVPKSIYRTHLLIWPLFLTIITVGTMKTSAGRHGSILLARIITTCHVENQMDLDTASVQTGCHDPCHSGTSRMLLEDMEATELEAWRPVPGVSTRHPPGISTDHKHHPLEYHLSHLLHLIMLETKLWNIFKHFNFCTF